MIIKSERSRLLFNPTSVPVFFFICVYLCSPPPPHFPLHHQEGETLFCLPDIYVQKRTYVLQGQINFQEINTDNFLDIIYVCLCWKKHAWLLAVASVFKFDIEGFFKVLRFI